MRNLLAMCLGLTLCQSALSHTYTLSSQSRTLWTEYESCGGGVLTNTAEAPDAGPFDMEVESNQMVASQDSYFESRWIVGSGSAAGGGGCGCGGGPFGPCQNWAGKSTFQAIFIIHHPTRFHLVYAYDTGPACVAPMNFSGPGGVIVAHTHEGANDVSGELAPGAHQFVISASACGGACVGCGNPWPSYFDFTLELRRFGDANGDSAVNVDDLLTVIGAWGPCPPKGPCDSDLNASGAVDVNDLLEVISWWGS